MKNYDIKNSLFFCIVKPLDNGEANGGEMWLSNMSKNNHFHVGYGRDSCRSISLPYLAMHLSIFNISSSIHKMRKPKSKRKNFLIYLHSNCVPFRENAFLEIAKYFKNVTIHFGGKCHGEKASNRKLKREIFSSKNIQQYNVQTRQRFYNNEDVTKMFRFCLVMENTFMMGYITEKIFNAFSGGCIPIYFGTHDIFQIFNEKAFIFYNISNPEKALKRISFLENNGDAFDSVIKEPIFRHPETFDEKLNVTGEIKKKIRLMVENKDTCK